LSGDCRTDIGLVLVIGGQNIHVETAGGEFLYCLSGAGDAGGAVDVAIRTGLVIDNADPDDRPGLGTSAAAGDGGSSRSAEDRRVVGMADVSSLFVI